MLFSPKSLEALLAVLWNRVGLVLPHQKPIASSKGKDRLSTFNHYSLGGIYEFSIFMYTYLDFVWCQILSHPREKAFGIRNTVPQKMPLWFGEMYIFTLYT